MRYRIGWLLSLSMLWCGGGETDGSADAGFASWTVLADSFDRVPLSAWGSGADDVWLAGGGFGAAGALALHFDGKSWTDVPVDTKETLWWVWGCDTNDVWFVGTNGFAARWNGSELAEYETDTTATLFGVWGSSCDDVWAVGGSPSGGENDVMTRFNGTAWDRPETLLLCEKASEPVACGVPYFKVWGSSQDDVFVVGQSGLVVRYDGSTWSRLETGTTATLFTVWGSGPKDVWAVGGQVGPALAIHYDGDAWTSVSGSWMDCGAMLQGVHVEPDGDTWLSGLSGMKFHQEGSTWTSYCQDAPIADLHATWGDHQGGAFVVGGNYLTECAGGCRGVVGHFGKAHPPLIE